MTSSRWLASPRPVRPRPHARVRVAAVAALAAVAIVGTARSAAADDRQVCLRASEKAQQLRNAGKLADAREQLGMCSRPECPKLVQQDCTQWMSELLATLPSVVPAAKDRNGRDLVDVKVSLDGKVVTQTLDGKALVVDPGVHTLRFETSGAPAVDEKVVVNPGEKNRIITVMLAKGDDAAAQRGAREGTGAGAGAAAGATQETSSSSSPPVAAYVVGGLGIVALGAALVVQLGANSDARNLRDTCAPKCNQSDVDDIASRYTVAGVTAGVGGALLITGVVMLFLHRDAPSSSAGTRASIFTFQPSPAGGGGAVVRF